MRSRAFHVFGQWPKFGFDMFANSTASDAKDNLGRLVTTGDSIAVPIDAAILTHPTDALLQNASLYIRVARQALVSSDSVTVSFTGAEDVSLASAVIGAVPSTWPFSGASHPRSRRVPPTSTLMLL